MSGLDELVAALNREVIKLYKMTAPMPIIMDRAVNKPVAADKATGLTTIQRPVPMFKDDALIRRMLRIEVSEKFFWMNMLREMRTDAFPTTFMGVAIYQCGPEHKLPECGWRVVNPFDKPVGS